LRAGFAAFFAETLGFAIRDAACRADLSAVARRAEAEAPEARRRAGFAALRRVRDVRADALRVVFFGALRPAFRLPAFAFRFAITGPFRSLTVYP
jgi:hypothetical protein